MTRYTQNCTIQFLLLLFGAGCDDVDWPESKYVDSLRVLGVQASPPTLRPGATTELSMRCVDGASGADAELSCHAEVAWFSQCNNPKENQPENCVFSYANWAKQLKKPLTDTQASEYPEGFGFGKTFSFKAPQDILQGNTTAEEDSTRYGTSYVFFAVCAGQLRLVENQLDQLPVECLDTKTGKRLDHRRFVTGVTTLYSYDNLTTQNPVLVNPRFDNEDIPVTCGTDSQCPEGFQCSTLAQCVPVVQHCTNEDPEKCPEHCLSFELKADSFNLFSFDDTRVVKERKFLWLSSLTNVGLLPADEADIALSAPAYPAAKIRTPCIRWQPPQSPTDHAHLWAVVRDNRGGFTAWDQQILVR